MARKSLSGRRVNWRKSSGQESSNGQEEADPPGRCRSARSALDGHESARLVIMVMSGQRSVEQPEGQRPARRMPGRQEISESQQDPGGQKGVDFEEPDTLLGTALSSQDGNEWSGRHRAARTPSSRISSRQTAGEHRLARGYQVAGAVEDPIGSNIILFLTPDSGQNLLESNNFVSQTCFRSKPIFLTRKPPA